MLDSDAFTHALRPLLASSAAYARSLLRSRQDAEDAVQQAALRAWQRIAQYDGARPFKGWWFAIVRNCCVDIQRHRQRSPGTDNLEGIDVAQEVSPERLDSQVLEAALGALPEAQREILRLRYFGDLSYAELAETLVIPKGTVMSRLHAARQALAALIPQEDP